MITAEPTEEQIQRMLAGESVRGPLEWRGKTLAPYTLGIKSLALKVLAPGDATPFHDAAILRLLLEAHGATKDEAFAKRKALMAATDNVEEFRARVNFDFLDDFKEGDELAARKLVQEILTPSRIADVKVTGGKKKEGKQGRTRTTTP
jgi:hypothetical protein